MRRPIFGQLVGVAILAFGCSFMQQPAPQSPAPPPVAVPSPAVHHEPAPDAPPVAACVGEPRILVRQIYHDWFTDFAGDEDTAASPREIADILTGRRNLPPGAQIYFGVDPDCGTDVEILYTVEGPGLTGTDVYRYEADHDRPYEGRLGKIKPGRFNSQQGHAGILVTYAPGPPEGSPGAGPSKSELRVRLTTSAGRVTSVPLVFPWVAGY